MNPRRVFFWAGLLALLLDQFTKLLVEAAYMTGEPPWQSVRIVGDFLRISPVSNPAGLFSWSYGPPVMHFILPLIGIGFVLWFALRNRDRWSALAYGILIGGAIGNLVDRVRLGWVIDFIDFRLPQLGFRWFTFNFADAFIVVGILVLLVREFTGRRRTMETDEPAQTGLQSDESN